MNIIFLLPLLAIVSAKTKIKPNAVNLAVETSLIFGDENIKNDLTIIDNLQDFLNKLKSYLNQREETNFRSEDPKQGIFTTFFKDFSRIIINYDNESLRNLTDVLALVMEPYYYQGTAFHNIIEDENLKSYIKDKLHNWADTDPKVLKYQMANAVMSKEDTPITRFGNYINKFFSEDDSKRLKKLLKKFNNHHEKGIDMHKLVKKTLQFVIFHRYNELEQTAKHDLSNALKNLTAFITNMHDTSNLGSSKKYFLNDKHNRTDKINIRRAQVKANPLLPEKIILQKDVELNVKAPEKEKTKDTRIKNDEADKLTTNHTKLQKLPYISEQSPYMSMEVKLDNNKHIAIETHEHAVDSKINSTHSVHEGRENEEVVEQTTLTEINKTATEKITTTIDTSISTTEISTQIDLYKQIMAINIEDEKEAANTDTEHNKETENENHDTRQPMTLALIQNSETEANITNKIVITAQNETISPKNKSKGIERRMGLLVHQVLPEAVADSNLDTDELKIKVDMTPQYSATVGYVDESNSNENEETGTETNGDDVINSDKEDYQNKISDGANKIRDLLDDAIAMKLLGVV